MVRAKADIEEYDDNGREAIIITELPYQVNKARLIERIADLVRGKLIEGISELRDESDKDGMRVVIELKRDEIAEVVLNNLYKQTPMESVFGINMVALLDGQPRLLNLKEMIDAFVRHRREVVTRRTVYDLRKARERAHMLEGLAVALANIDEVIALIKASPSPAEAKAGAGRRTWSGGVVPEMLERAGAINARPDGLEEALGLHGGTYRLSESQAQAILDLRLHRLTGLEQDKILDEYGELLDIIRDLSRHPRATGAPAAGDPRRTDPDPRPVRRRAPHAHRARRVRPDDRRPDHAAGRRRDACRTAATRRRSRSASTVRRGAAVADVRPRRSRTRISSTSCSSRTRTTRCCASRAAASSTG